MRHLLTAAAILILPVNMASAQEFQLDRAHSSVNFAVRHLVSTVHGTFDSFQGKFNFEPGKPK